MSRTWKDRGMDSAEKSTLCICPICDKKHYIVMFWTGRGTPKMFCRECKNIRRELG